MRSHVMICAVLVLALFANAEERRDVPSPALTSSWGSGKVNNISMSEIGFVRGGMNTGTGLDAAVSHYFSKHFGVAADADLLRSDFVNFSEYGYRVGPTVRFNPAWRIQPFARSLFGYSRFRENNTGPQRPYVNGFSYLVGAGGDVWLAGPISARLAADYEQNPNVPDPRPAATRMLRFTMGLSYQFGSAGR